MNGTTTEPHPDPRSYLSVRIALWALALVMLVNLALGGLLFLTRAHQTQSDQRFRDLVVCQVHHNTLTANALQHRDSASKAATRAEMTLWRGIRRALREGTLTGPVLGNLVNAYIFRLGHLQDTRYANPYPPGGLCDQLMKEAQADASGR